MRCPSKRNSPAAVRVRKSGKVMREFSSRIGSSLDYNPSVERWRQRGEFLLTEAEWACGTDPMAMLRPVLDAENAVAIVTCSINRKTGIGRREAQCRLLRD